MGKEDSPATVNALATRLKDPEESLAVKLEIVTSLALIGSQSSFSILVNILKETEMQQPVTRALAAAALGAWREQKGLDPLLETLEDEKEPIVQWKILNALRKIGTDRGTILIEQFTQPFHPTYIREEAEGILNLSE